ncbi:MAG: hypothetical protein ACI944_002652 [Natronomonas sp.]|jgi:hypothetical protein
MGTETTGDSPHDRIVEKTVRSPWVDRPTGVVPEALSTTRSVFSPSGDT